MVYTTGQVTLCGRQPAVMMWAGPPVIIIQEGQGRRKNKSRQNAKTTTWIPSQGRNPIGPGLGSIHGVSSSLDPSRPSETFSTTRGRKVRGSEGRFRTERTRLIDRGCACPAGRSSQGAS